MRVVMRLSRALKDKMMDVRLRDKLVTEGLITKKELEEFLKGLEDDEKNSTSADLDRDIRKK